MVRISLYSHEELFSLFLKRASCAFLFFSPSGSGKTSLLNVLANRMPVSLAHDVSLLFISFIHFANPLIPFISLALYDVWPCGLVWASQVAGGATLKGSFSVNGEALREPEKTVVARRRFARLSAYVMQDDALMGFLTVKCLLMCWSPPRLARV